MRRVGWWAVLVVFVVGLFPLQVLGSPDRLPPAAAAETSTGSSEEYGTLEGPMEGEPSDPAYAEAAATGERVEIVSRRNATQTLWANPDGSTTMEVAAAPVRVWKRLADLDPTADPAAEGWVDIDVTLVERDGVLQPKVTAPSIRLSPGGSGELARMEADGKAIGISWPGSLPAPTVEGPVARYVGVFKGADLEVETLDNGFKWRLVLHERPAKTLTFDVPLHKLGLTATQTLDGQLELADAEGNLVSVSDPAVMWGAEVDDRSAEPTRTAPVKTELVETANGQVLRVSPDHTFLSDPGVQLPITIDPSPTFAVALDTFLSKAYPSTSYDTSTTLKAGTYNGGSEVTRSLLKFDVSTLAGKHILSAGLKLWNYHSYSCSHKTVYAQRLTSSFSSSTTWSNQPTATTSGQGSASFAEGYSSSCPDAWASIPVEQIVQAWANGTANYGLRVVAASETDSYGWKKFNSANASSYKPYLAVTYNSYPKTVSGRAISPTPYIVNGNHFVKSLTPKLTGNFCDDDGGTGKNLNEIWDAAKTTKIIGAWTTGVTSCSATAWTVPSGKLANGTSYWWRAKSYDYTDYSKSWSSWVKITPDVSGPAAPSVSSSTHTSQSTWYPNDDPAVSWSATDLSGIYGYSWVRDQTSSTTPDTTSEGTGTSATFSNLADGVHYFHVRARDNVGNWGTTRHFTIRIDDTAPAAPSVSSSTHPTQTSYYTSNDPAFSWTASDTSLITGYSYVLDQVSTTTPDTTSEGTATTVSFADKADGAWWFHVRAKNGSGLWSTPRHYKVLIDTTMPSTPTVSSDSHPDSSLWYQSKDLSASWTASTDGGSGVAGYLVTIDGAPDTKTETGTLQTTTTWTHTVADNGIYYVHVRPKDVAGNWGEPAHYKFNIGAFDPTAAYGIQPFTTWSGGVNGPFGNFVETATDLDIPTAGPGLEVSRSYNSMSDWVGGFGRGWTHTYGMMWSRDTDGNVIVLYPDGRRGIFTPNADGTFTPPSGFSSVLATTADSGFSLTEKDRTVYTFASDGYLSKVTDAAGRSLTLAYDAYRKLTTVTDDTSGRKLTYGWTNAKITSIASDAVAAHGGALVWRYYYNADELIAACDPRDNAQTGKCTTYSYTDGRISQVTLPRGNVSAKVGYATDGRVLWQEDGQANRTSFHHPTAGVVDVTNPNGVVTRVVYDENHRTQAEQFDFDAATNTARGGTMSYSYDTAGYRSKIVDPNGTTTSFTYDARGNELSQTCVGCSADGTDETTWSTYDANDNLIAVHDARSASATDDTYKISYTYNAAGELTSETTPPVAGHPGGITSLTRTYTTGTETAVGGGSIPPGLLASETDAADATTSYLYTAAGDLAETHHPSGAMTRHGYDEIGRVVSTSEISVAVPDGATTTFGYDQLSNVVVETAPAVLNPVSGVTHQARTTHVYDDNSNLVSTTLADLTGGDVSRTTSFTYDLNDRETSTTDPEGGLTSRAYDSVGNVVRVTDAEGRITDTSYNSRNQPTTVTLANYDPGDGSSSPVVLQKITHGPAGRVVDTTDAKGRLRTFTYDGADRLLTETLTNFTHHDGTVSSVVLRRRGYDKAGNLTSETTGNGTRTVVYAYDAASRQTSVTVDPSGLARTTTYTYNPAGDPTVVTSSGAGRTEETRYTYDTVGNLVTETVENGTDDLVTRHGYDDRGLLTATTDPRGASLGEAAYTTSYSHDLLGRVTNVRAPEVNIESDGAAAAVARPEMVTGYNTFGEPTHVTDARGATTTTGYDRNGRATTVTHPAYTPPGSTTAIEPTESFTYDLVGNLTARTTRRGQVYSWRFDSLNRNVTETAPAAQTGGVQPVTQFGYDLAGNLTTRIDPTGAKTTYGYDELDQLRSTTVHVRVSGQPDATHTTHFGYDPAGDLTIEVDPTGAATTHGYNGAGDRISTTDAAGQTWGYEHDLAGRLTASIDPLGVRLETDYDLAGRPTTTRHRAADGTLVATETIGYDPAGNPTSRTSPRGYTTTSSFDGANQLRGVSVPVDATSSISTGYGYDAAGNLTRMTDGRGNAWIYGYTPWNLPATVVEPATTAHPDPTDRTYTTVYDAGGLPVEDRQPGGIVAARSFDNLGQLTGETATGSGVASASRVFGYDLAGRRTSFNHPSGTQSLVYDDRGLLASTTGPAGNATFGYDAAGRLVSRTDAAGTASFTWTARGELDVATEPLTGARLDHDWDAAGRLTQISLGNGTVRGFDFDVRGQLIDDRWTDSLGATLYAQTYSYDADGNVTYRTVTQAGQADQTHAYGYDHAGRLTSWNANGTTTAYSWDANSNRLTAGTETFTYDERNRLTTGPDGTYSHTPRGTLASVTGGAGTATWSFDALGRMVGHQPAGTPTAVAFAYDDLDRIAARDTAAFAYTGFNLDPTSDGTTIYSRSPAGRLLALNDGTGAKLANLDRHGDLVGLLDTTGTPTATRTYTPFGQIHSSVGTFAGQAGFQGDWTDPASGEVWQGARWYQPNTGTFTARDTVFGELATPMTLNRYLYANANPLNYFDPDGRFSMHLAERSSKTYVKKMASSSTSRAKRYAPVAKARQRAETQRKVNAARPVLARDNARKPATVVQKVTQTRITASLAKANRTAAAKMKSAATKLTKTTAVASGSQAGRKAAEARLSKARADAKKHNCTGFWCGFSAKDSARVAGKSVANFGMSFVDAAIETANLVSGSDLPTVGPVFKGDHAEIGYTVGNVTQVATAVAAPASGARAAIRSSGGLGPAVRSAASSVTQRLRSAPRAPAIKPGSAGGQTAGQRFPSSVRREALEENPSTCVYCRMETSTPQVDHAISRARGGDATLENAQTTCPWCNASKGARDYPVNPPPGYEGGWPPWWWDL